MLIFCTQAQVTTAPVELPSARCSVGDAPVTATATAPLHPPAAAATAVPSEPVIAQPPQSPQQQHRKMQQAAKRAAVLEPAAQLPSDRGGGGAAPKDDSSDEEQNTARLKLKAEQAKSKGNAAFMAGTAPRPVERHPNPIRAQVYITIHINQIPSLFKM